MTSTSNLVPKGSKLEIPANELVERIAWIKITIKDKEGVSSHPWPVICYKNYTEFLQHLGDDLPQQKKIKIALHQLLSPECINQPMAHLLGRQDFDVVEMTSDNTFQPGLTGFMLAMGDHVNMDRIKAALLPRYPTYFLDYHRGLDEAVKILAGASNTPEDGGNFLQKAQSILDEDSKETQLEAAQETAQETADMETEPVAADAAELASEETTDMETVDMAVPKTPVREGNEQTKEPQMSQDEEEMKLGEEEMQQDETSLSASDSQGDLLTQPAEEEDEVEEDGGRDEPKLAATEQSGKLQKKPDSKTFPFIDQTSTDEDGGIGRTKPDVPEDMKEGEEIETEFSDFAEVVKETQEKDAEKSQPDTRMAMVDDTDSASQPESQEGNLKKMTSSSPSVASESPTAARSQPSSPTVVSVCDSTGSGATCGSTEVSESSIMMEDPGIQPNDDWDAVLEKLQYVGWAKVATGEIIPVGGCRDGVKGRDVFDEEGAKEFMRQKWGWKGHSVGKNMSTKKAATTPKRPLTQSPSERPKRSRRSPKKPDEDDGKQTAISKISETRLKLVDDFKTLMPKLQDMGWQYRRSVNPFKNWSYVLPGRDQRTGQFGIDFFHEEDEVVEFVKNDKEWLGRLKELDSQPVSSTPAPQTKNSSRTSCLVTPGPAAYGSDVVGEM